MQRRPLGKTGLEVSCLGFGAASLWGMPFFDERAAQSVLCAAVESGLNYIDTGPTYSRGNAEPRLAGALASLGGRHDLVISTKVGTRQGAGGRLVKDFSPGWIRKSVEASLLRLGLDQLPLLLLHGPRLEDIGEPLLVALGRLRQEGKVSHFGINSFETEVLRAVPTYSVFSVVMLDFNLIKLDRESLIADLAETGIGILAGEPLAQHVFTARPLRLRGMRDLWYLARILRNRPADLLLNQKYRFMRDHPAGTPAQLALAFVLANQDVASAVFSTTRIKHLMENLAAASMQLPSSVDEMIRRAYVSSN